MRRLLLSVWVSGWRGVVFGAAWVFVLVAGFLFVCVGASAEFTRPYLSQVRGTPTGPSGEVVPFVPPLVGLAVDPVSGGDVWVGDQGSMVVDVFDASSGFVEQVMGFPTGSLAYDDTGAKLYGTEPGEQVAVDDSVSLSDDARGDVYFASDGGASKRLPNGSVRRVEAGGAAAPFTCAAGVAEGYIVGGQLVGKPGELWSSGTHLAVKGVAVDSGSGGVGSGVVPGDVYVLNATDFGGNEVDQFTPEGCFVGAFSGVGVPSRPLGSSVLSGIAVDPMNGDVVVEAEERLETGSTEVIDEFSSSGEYLGQVTGPSKGVLFGAPALNGSEHGGGVAVSSEGHLYVNVCERVEEAHGNCEAGGDVVDVFGEGAFYAGVVTGGVSGDVGGRGVLGGVVRGVAREVEEGGVVVDRDLVVSRCVFEVVSEGVFVREGFVGARVVPCVLDESGLSPDGVRLSVVDHGVHGVVGGLVEGEVYDYRLVVETAGGERGGVKVGAVASFASAGVPVVGGVSVGGVSSSFAVFGGVVDPRGAGTSYRFEFVEAGVYGAAVAGGAADPFAGGGVVPVPAGFVGAGDRGVSVSVPVGGLVAGTVYEYRLVAWNSVGETDGAVGVFATVPTGPVGLPDGRAYELLTPVNKGDAEDLFGGPPGTEAKTRNESYQNYDLGYASEEGNQFLLMVTAVAFGPFPGSGANSYVFSRGPGGWSYRSDASPELGVQSSFVELFDPVDFSVLGVDDEVGSQSEEELGLVGPPGGPLCGAGVSTGCYESVVAGSKGEVELSGGSQDLGSVVIENAIHRLPLCDPAQEALEKELHESSRGVFEWSKARGCLSLVDVKSVSEGGALVGKCGAVLGLGPEGYSTAAGSTRGAVSLDGSRVFFTAPDPKAGGAGCWEEGHGKVPPQLYVRLRGETTLEVSAPEPGGEREPGYPALYVGASEDGSKVFFLTRSELTKEAVTLGGSKPQPELYECEVVEEEGGARCVLTRIAAGHSEIAGRIADVPAVSGDGSMVYFNANAEGGSEGGLYGYDTLTGVLTRIAAEQGYVAGNYSGTAFPWYDPSPNEPEDDEVKGELVAGLDIQAPYVTTRDGKYLLFGAYRYDAGLAVSAGNPVCVMCNPDGSGPIPEPEAMFTRSAVHANNDAGGPPHAISEDGRFVFFDTTASLVPQDTNGTLDVYEWAEDGAGSCGEAKGCISLISSGQDPSPSFFLDASSYVNPKTGETVDGGNVFFGSHANLIPSLNTASEGNLYDARIEGGFPGAAVTGPCEGDACSNPPPAPPAVTPGSLTFTGPGNETPPPPKETKPCKRGQVRRAGKCVKRAAKKSARKKDARKSGKDGRRKSNRKGGSGGGAGKGALSGVGVGGVR